MATWQPIESAPRDGTNILAWDGLCIESVSYDECLQLWVTSWAGDEEYGQGFPPTHWMPLPAPPAEDTHARVLRDAYLSDNVQGDMNHA